MAGAFFKLGKAENTIPAADYSDHAELRAVYIASHPLSLPFIGEYESKWIKLLERSQILPADGLSAFNHWAVLVGDYYHELNADGEFDILYQNGREDDGKHKWDKRKIGTTHFNDEAIRVTGEKVITQMPRAYSLTANNCQNMVMLLAHAIDPNFQTTDELRKEIEEYQAQSNRENAKAVMDQKPYFIQSYDFK